MPRASTKRPPKAGSGKKLIGKFGEAYRASINLCGPYSPTPTRCRWKPNDCNPDSDGEFWGNRGDADIRAEWQDGENLLPHGDSAFIVFASRDEQRVKDWIAGARAVLMRLRDFSAGRL
jgi:hypothetical protein